MQRRQTVCRILWKASDGRANQLIRLHRAGFVFLLLVRPREGVPWANEEHARCKPTASGDPSVDLRMVLSRCCQSPGCHLSRPGRHHEKRFVKSPAHLQAMPCVWLAESIWALKLGTTAPKQPISNLSSNQPNGRFCIPN